MKKPNIIHENVLSFIQEFPKELNLTSILIMNFSLIRFLEPLKSILDAIGWSVEKKVNLDSFFS